MSNNARVVERGEIGTAQYLQALAAGLEPDVRMNPVLVKPEGEARSQVVVLGRPDLELGRLPWQSRQEQIWPIIEQALRHLRAQHEVVLIEGAGSPAEINLRTVDLANMRTAKFAEASVVRGADIDRGGAFAHLYGTWALLSDDERSRIVAFVLNKFRGDPSLLPPAPEQLEQLTGVPTLGVIPWLDHGLPDEDGVSVPRRLIGETLVAVVRYPTASNLDEFRQLEQVAELRWVTRPEEIERASLLILPGSKHVAADLAWLDKSGLAAAVTDRAAHGMSVLGICGGMQMLGQRINGEGEVEGSGLGLGLLPIDTAYCRSKHTEKGSVRFRPLSEPWAALSGKTLRGYQIRHGRSTATAHAAEALPRGLGFVSGSVLGIYAHGLFEEPDVLRALFGKAPARSLEQTFEELADAIEEHVDVSALLRRAGIA
jgi:adenosylcobyric acid synthase